MSLTYTAGSQRPTSAELSTLKGQTIGASTLNELRIVVMELDAHATGGIEKSATVTSLLP